MLTPEFLRRQAENCLRIARSCFDLASAERLRLMAAELNAKAAEMDEDRPAGPLAAAPWSGTLPPRRPIADNPPTRPSCISHPAADRNVHAPTACLAVLATLTLAALPAAAQNQEPGKTAFTGKTISIVVPFSPGAVSDPLARLIAPRLAEILGANVIVENKAGANTNLGNLHVARSQPDGHTLLLAGTALTVNVAFYKDKLPFDPLKDFTPITLVAVTNSALVVNPSVEVTNPGELIALLKSKPGALNYASAGSGNMTHLVMEFFKLKAGVDVTHVPYRGAGPALNDVIAGHASMMVISPGPTRALYRGRQAARARHHRREAPRSATGSADLQRGLACRCPRSITAPRSACWAPLVYRPKRWPH